MSALVVFAALGLVVQAAGCPGECSCRNAVVHNTTTTSLVCANLTTAADFGPLFAHIHHANASHLALVDCGLANLTIAGLDSLQSLDMSHNHISQLPALNLTRLFTLDLSRNEVRAIYGAPFRTLCMLRVLNLSANAIETVSADAFRGLHSLQSLDLSQNQLSTLGDRLLVSLVNLQHLNLSGNRLEKLSEGCFGTLLHLQQLDVSKNRLAHVSPGTLQALPSLSRLLLAGNPALGDGIKEAALLVGTGRRLQTVDASRTGLTHVPAALTHSVRTLRLADNRIRTVRCGDLDSYPLLQLLDLTTNQLEEIEEDALGRLEMLAVLYLTDNKLRAIPRSLPDGLEILHLESNQIEQIVSGDLLGLPKLEVLLLNDNQIKVVQEGAFSQVSALVTLDLSRNPISILPAGTLAGPARLQMLRLTDLSIEPPAEDMAFPVQSPEHLVRLDLSNSAGLARQLLADTAALAAFRELQELNLENTGLTNLRSDLLHFLPQLRDFHLTGNRLNCSGLLWLALWMRRQDQPEYRKVSCASPPELYGTLVVDLQDTDVSDDSYQTLPAAPTERTTLPDFNETTNHMPVFANEKVAFNNVTVTESSTLTITRTTKSSEGKNRTNDWMWTEMTAAATGTVAGYEHTIAATASTHRSTAAADQLHSFPIVTRPSTDKTKTAPVTDGRVGEINPSGNRVATEPFNYETNASSVIVGGWGSVGSSAPSTAPTRNNETYADELTTGDLTNLSTADGAEPYTGVIGTAGQMSMYSSDRQQPTGAVLMHPGMLVLVGAALAAGAILSTVISHVRSRRKHAADNGGYNRHQDIEVNSLASMNELW